MQIYATAESLYKRDRSRLYFMPFSAPFDGLIDVILRDGTVSAGPQAAVRDPVCPISLNFRFLRPDSHNPALAICRYVARQPDVASSGKNLRRTEGSRHSSCPPQAHIGGPSLHTEPGLYSLTRPASRHR